MNKHDAYLKDSGAKKPYRDDGFSTQELLIGAATVAGTVAAFKKGLFRPISKKILEKTANRKPTITMALNDMKTWINNYDSATPGNSILRNGIISNVKNGLSFNYKKLADHDILNNPAKVFSDRQKGIVSDTKEDIRNYLTRLKSSQERMLGRNGKLGNRPVMQDTDLLYSINDMEKAIGSYSETLSGYKRSLRGKIGSSLIDGGSLNADAAAKQLKRTGYRKATIEDFFDIMIGEDGKISLYEKKDFDFSFKQNGTKQNKKDLKSAREKIEDLLNSDYLTSDGYRVKSKRGDNMKLYEKNDKFRDLIVDEDILIGSKFKDSSGKVLDLRDQRRSIKETIRNLSTEWQIPVIGVNPFRMLGGNKLGLKRNRIRFGTITEDNVAPFLTGRYGNTERETIRNLKHEVDVLKGVKEGVTIIDGDVFRVADDGVGLFKMGYKEKKELIRVGKNQDYGTNIFSPLESSILKIGGINKKSFTDFGKEEKGGFFKNILRHFDIGYQQSTAFGNETSDIFAMTNPDTYYSKLFDNKFKKPYKKMDEKKTFSTMVNPTGVGSGETIFAINKTKNVKSLFKKDKDGRLIQENFDSFFKQFIASTNKEDFESVTRLTAVPHFFTERLNQTLSKVGLGLSAESTKDFGSTITNLITKRFVPIYGGYKAWDTINMIGEGNEDNKPGNLEQRLLKTYARIDTGLHGLADSFGITKIAKTISDITPGSDMIGELPGINLLNLDQTSEERKDYWQKGYKPIRKGRYWSTNSTPFIGGKIQYYRANALRTSLADAEHSDSLYGSRKEKIIHSLNKNYYDNKNYYTRPYLMSSTAFDQIPFVGKILSSTVGKFVGKSKKMHEEYWNGDTPKSMKQIKTEEMILKVSEESQRTLTSFEEIGSSQQNTRELIKSSSELNAYERLKSIELVNSILARKTIDREERRSFISNLFDTIRGFLNKNKIDKDKYTRFIENNGTLDSSLIPGVQSPSEDYYLYKTNGGGLRTLDVGSGTDKFQTLKTINKLKKAPSKSPNSKVGVSIQDEILSSSLVDDKIFSNPKNPYSISTGIKDQLDDAMNVGGIYGFSVSGFVTGNPGEGESRIETSGYSRSFAKKFYDAELGGIGGDVSEIFRRLVQGKRKDVNHFNPIRNRMPDWLPGDEGFTNFQRGDAYSKIAYGEERLPGHGFERLNNIDTKLLFEMRVGSSTMGKTKDEMIKHFLHADDITDESIQRIVKGGTKTHVKVEKQLLQAGIAKDVEGKIEDKENGIVGWYDVRLHDRHSKTGEAIMDIKTISDKGFKEVKKNNAPKDEHQRQVNWYLHNTNKKSKGYVYYINRDNPSERLNLGFDYDKKMYESSMSTLKAARSGVMNMLETGEVKRGDLYKTMDKYRVLADVAPYSEEFMEMNNHMSALDLSEAEKEEVRTIRERVTKIKEPLRLYEYKFKRNNTTSANVEVGKKIDSERYMIKGTDDVIKLAGVNITKSSENYEKAEKYLNKVLEEGKNVKIEYAKDELKQHGNDMYKSAKAVVYSNGKNVNKELIKRGYAEEDKKDFSAAGVKARFNSAERTFGKIWESVAHLDTIANTKFLQARTAVEDYERKHVYNKDFKKWQNPVDDFLKPFAWTNMKRTGGVLVGAGLGYLFGGRSPFGRLLGTVVGATTMGAAKVYKGAYEKTTGETWIPEEVRRTRDINEYMDKLNFVKNRRLFELYSAKAMKEDGQDVKKIIKENKVFGKSRKKKARSIQEVKVKRGKGEDVSIREMEKAGIDIPFEYKLPKPIRKLTRIAKDGLRNIFEKKDKEVDEVQDIIDERERKDRRSPEAIERMEIKKKERRKAKYFENLGDVVDAEKDKAIKDAISASYNKNTNEKSAFKLGMNAMKAIDYYNKSEATMYGYDPGEEVNNFISALPKKERQYFRKFQEADEKDRKRILEIAPDYMQRALRASYKMNVPEKGALSSYFKEHYLPGEAWEGWRENYDLNSMKVKVVQQQDMNLQSFDLWEQDKVKADMYGKSAIPNIDKKTMNINSVKNKLSSILLGAGYRDLDFSMSKTNVSTTNINFDLAQDYEENFNTKLKERLADNGYL